MKNLFQLNIFLLLAILLSPTHALAARGHGGSGSGGGGVVIPTPTSVSEVDINDAVVSNWFTVTPSQMPAGTTHYAFRSPSNNADVGYSVYLPPDYATNTTKEYPVMYWAHGKGGNEVRALSWLPGVVEKAIKDKKIEPMIVVFPNAGGTTMWVDNGSLLPETMVINELIPLIDSKFRTIQDRSGRFLEGFSMGGFGAAHFLFTYPELFSSAVTYGGAYQASELDSSGASKTMINNYVNSNSPYPVKIRIVVGTEDVTLDSNQAIESFLSALPISYEYQELTGLTHSAQPYYTTDGIEGFNFHY
jgi:endo-1,4-beta-xylanase